MNRTIKNRLAGGIAVVAAVGAAAAPAAIAATEGTGSPTPRIGNGLSYLDERYLKVRADFVAENGRQAAGRNLVRYGSVEKGGNVRPATDAEIERSTEYMATPAAPESPKSATSEVSSGGGSMNATVMCESGGDYSAATGNGYYGGYQFDSGTWDAYGDPAYPEASDAPPEVQDAAAASVPYDAWPNC